jgi:hypothetical protein
VSSLLTQAYRAPTPYDVSQTYHFVSSPSSIAYGSLRSFNYDITWTTTATSDCDIRLSAGFDNADYQALRCVNKPAMRVPTLDGPDSPALCGTLQELKDLCVAIEACHSVTFHDNHGSRGYLNSFACGEAANIVAEPTSTLHTKNIGSTPDCVLGTGVEVVSPYAMVHGVYEKQSDSLYSHVDTLSTVEWDAANGCGWVVYRSTDDTAAPTPAPAVCQDNNDLVNFLFGLSGSDKVATICSMAGAWGDGSYCYNPTFAALCASTCGTDCAADATGTDATGADLCPATDCTDEVNAALCPVTCPADGRRLTRSPARALSFRAEMRDHRLSSKHKRRSKFQAERARRARSLASPEARKLGWTSDLLREVAYQTWVTAVNETQTASDCADAGATPDASLLDAPALADLVAFHYPTGITMEHTCPGGDRTWVTDANVYCPLNNIPALYTTNKMVADHQCHRKCSFLAPAYRYVDEINADTGENNWCSGNQADFMAETDALCLPREKCEELCLSLGDACVSIDMHNWLPQCYLNTGSDCAPGVYESNYSWSVLTTGVTPDESNATHDGMRDTFHTQTGKNCTCDRPECMGPGALAAAGRQSWYTPVGAPGTQRTECENLCRHDEVCTGFAMRSANVGLADAAAADSGSQFAACMFFYNETCMVDADSHSPYVDPAAVDFPEGHIGRTAFASSQFTLVQKVPHKDCTVSVDTPAHLAAVPGDVLADPRDDESGPLHITGVYTKIEGGKNYLRSDNMTRLSYEEGTHADGTCDGWDIQFLTNGVVEVPLENCTDNPRLANYFLREFDGQSGNFDHPCQWGYEQHKCRDPVFHALCAHTCTTFVRWTIAGRGYLWQDNDLYGSEDHNSTCDGDNNWAAHAWEHLYRFNQPGHWRTEPNPSAMPAAPDATTMVACMTISGANYTFDKSACAGGTADSLDWSGIFNYLCPETCAEHPLPTEEITYRPVDEAEPEGALFGLAQLPVGTRRLRYHDRRLQVSGITTSNSGARSSSMVVTYLDGYAPDAQWVTLYQTWRPGSHDPASPYAGADFNATNHIVPGTACSATAVERSQAALDMLDTMELFPSELRADPEAKMRSVCRGAGRCPRFTTCVVSPLRFDDELYAAFGADKSGFLGPLGNLDAITDLDADDTNPKVLISEHRATAIVAQEKFELGAHLFRNVPGTTRVELTDVDKAAEVVVMSMVSPTAASGYYARTELGRHYPAPAPVASFAGWVTDVLRLETFANPDNTTRKPVAAAVSLSFYLGPVARPDLLRVVRIPSSGDSSLVEVDPTLAYDATAGTLAVELGEANADFAVALARDACEETTPCDANARCTNVETAPLHHLVATCACTPGYAGSGLDGDCALTPGALDDTSDMDYYLSIAHGDVLSFGWRINEIELYADAECTRKVPFTGRDGAMTEFPAWGGGQDTTYETITKVSQVYTGPIGYAHYPHPADMADTRNPFRYGNANLFDNSQTTQWWSECLNCNPDVPAKIEFNVKGRIRIECIKVYQEADFAAGTVVVERGPMRGPAGCSIDGSDPDAPPCTCGMLPSLPRCEPSMIWSEHIPAAPEGEAVAIAQVSTDCGYDSTQIFGELLLVTGTNWEGSYANDHPVQSACHCHQLCVLHMEQGCRSWKHYEEEGGIKHCYLQSNIFEQGEGFYGAGMSSHPKVSDEWTSGTIARRYVKNKRLLERPYLFSAATSPPDVETAVMGGDAMSITVHGAGMPYSSVKANDASDLQRIKLVKAEDSCAVQVPKEVTGISCIESVKSVDLMAGAVETKVYTFCGPRPSAADADSATFSGIKISRADEDRTYKVCYCAFDCFEPSRWQEAPTRLAVAGSIFSWTTTPNAIYRKDRLDALGGIDLDVTVTRPAFGSHSPNGDWRLKLVRDWYSCDVDQNPQVVGTDAVLTPASCDGPDVCTWGYTVNMELADVGRYHVCFSTDGSEYIPIPAADGRKYLEVLKLDADFEHPRGIFHNQQFSALAGSAIALPLKLAGTRMAIPASGAVTFTAGACGDYDAYLFNGTVVKGPTGDTTAPVLVPADSLPINGATSGPAHLVQLAFDEPVTNEGCGTASIHVRSAAATIAQSYACADLVIEGNLVLLSNPAPTFTASAGTNDYFVEIETGAVSDLSGNPVVLDVTANTFRWTVGADTDDSPTILRTLPTHQSNIFDGTVTLTFSELVAARAAAGTFAVKLVACGSAPPADECTAADSVVQTYVLDLAASYTQVITLGSVAVPNARYQVTVPQDAVEDAAANTGPAADHVFEFVYDDTGFAVADVVRLASGSDAEMSFHVQLSADTPEGKYSVCYCSGQTDSNLADVGDYAKRYKLMEDKKCANSARLAPSATVEVMGFTLEDHVCATKCGPGCIGPHCFCEGYAGEAGARTLCLPKQLCADACTETASCVGIVVHDDLPQCELLEAACDTGGKVEEEWQYFRKDAGSACTHFQDFDEAAGSLIVTSRVDVAVDYVFTPNVVGSIELTAPEGAGFTADGLLSRDRITIIDCGGTCGISSPTRSVSLPAMADKINTWNNFPAESYFLDPAHVDAENPGGEKVTVHPEAPGQLYTEFDGKFVAGHNLNINSGLEAVIDGQMRGLWEHQCHWKCSQGCTGDHCYCDGYFAGVDGDASNALCAPEDLCTYLCDNVQMAGEEGTKGAACKSIDVHTSLNRCFLNDGMADTHVDTLARDADYKVLVKRSDVNQENVRRLDSHGEATPTSILEVQDLGYSWNQMLRFKGVTFKSGGTFKLCFCDSSLLGGSSACRSEADYSVEVGTIHASGVSCLIAKPELQRVSCVDQYWGSSLRCYRQYTEPPRPTPPAYGAITDPSAADEGAGGAGADQTTRCAMMSEEEADADPQCQANAER